MRKDLVFNHFSKALDYLLEEDEVFSFLFQNPRDLTNSVFYKNFSVYFGASRFCIVDNNYPFVVKVEYDEPFETFEDISSFCERELFFYERAQELNFDKYFTEVQYLGTYTKKVKTYSLSDFYDYYDYSEYDKNDFLSALEDMEKEGVLKKEIEISIPLYAYEKADCFVNDSCYSSKEIDYYRSLKSPLSEISAYIAANFIKDYGEEEFYEFSEFLKYYNIRDIHAGNVGFINGKIVIIDYASYPKESGYESDSY